MKEKILSAVRLLILVLVAVLTLAFGMRGRSIKVQPGDVVLVHGYASNCTLKPQYPAHWQKGQPHQDWLLSCEWGLD